MRVFLITLAFSTAVSVVFWEFGLAQIIWPAHPFVTTLFLAVGAGIGAQLVASRHASPISRK